MNGVLVLLLINLLSFGVGVALGVSVQAYRYAQRGRR